MGVKKGEEEPVYDQPETFRKVAMIHYRTEGGLVKNLNAFASRGEEEVREVVMREDEEGEERRNRVTGPYIISFPKDLGKEYKEIVEEYQLSWSRDASREGGMNSTEQMVVDLTPLQVVSFKSRMITPSSNEDFPPFMIFPDHTFREGPRGGERLMNIIFYGGPPNHNILHERFGIEYMSHPRIKMSSSRKIRN